jgi:hypothetical protein
MALTRGMQGPFYLTCRWLLPLRPSVALWAASHSFSSPDQANAYQRETARVPGGQMPSAGSRDQKLLHIPKSAHDTVPRSSQERVVAHRSGSGDQQPVRRAAPLDAALMLRGDGMLDNGVSSARGCPD